MKTNAIRVQGHGSVSQAPDQILLSFKVEEKSPDYSKAIEGSNDRIAAIRNALRTTKVDPALLKTTHFDIRDEDKYASGRHTHIGFIALHTVGISIPFDNALVGQLLAAVSASKADPSVKVSFSISDPESLKQRVLASAVENATSRARIIANAAGVKLGGIQNIEYGYAEIRVSSDSFDMGSSTICDSAPDIAPENIDAEDTVTVTWEIEQ